METRKATFLIFGTLIAYSQQENGVWTDAQNQKQVKPYTLSTWILQESKQWVNRRICILWYIFRWFNFDKCCISSKWGIFASVTLKILQAFGGKWAVPKAVCRSILSGKVTCKWGTIIVSTKNGVALKYFPLYRSWPYGSSEWITREFWKVGMTMMLKCKTECDVWAEGILTWKMFNQQSFGRACYSPHPLQTTVQK